jgi:hypothetical protein
MPKIIKTFGKTVSYFLWPPAVLDSSRRVNNSWNVCDNVLPFPLRSAGPAYMPHHEIHDSGSLDNSGCKRLRISSLVDDMAEEENIYDLYASAIELLDEMSSRSMATEHWSKMLDKAFGKEDVISELGASNFWKISHN